MPEYDVNDSVGAFFDKEEELRAALDRASKILETCSDEAVRTAASAYICKYFGYMSVELDDCYSENSADEVDPE